MPRSIARSHAARLVLVGMAATLHLFTPRVVPAQGASDISRLSWLAGCWELRTPSRVAHEQWMAPLGDLMLGASRTVVGGAVREYEQVRIERADGVATYVAQPVRQQTTAFAATEISDSSVTFANPAHDFPQRIGYRRLAAGDSLLAWIDGVRGGTTRTVRFPMRRVDCSLVRP